MQLRKLILRHCRKLVQSQLVGTICSAVVLGYSLESLMEDHLAIGILFKGVHHLVFILP
jgi:hypothetical protein